MSLGLGGGFDERGTVEYKPHYDSDGEFDEFGRRKKKKKGGLSAPMSITQPPPMATQVKPYLPTFFSCPKIYFIKDNKVNSDTDYTNLQGDQLNMAVFLWYRWKN